MVETQTGRDLIAEIEHLGYDAYDAAGALLDKIDQSGGGGRDWERVIAMIEVEAKTIVEDELSR